MLLQARAYRAAYDSLSRSVRLAPDNEAALAGLIDAAGPLQQLPEVQRLLESLTAARTGGSAVRIALARLLASTGAFDQAALRAQEVMAADADDPRGAELLASILADAGAVDRLRPLVARMQQKHPDREDTGYYAAMVSFLGGNLPEAIVRAERVVQMNPHNSLAYNLIGSASAGLGHRDRAREAFRASLEANPREASTYVNLGRLELESGNPGGALAYFVESLTLDPNDERARASLSAALFASRRP
jgi:Flp pilus assembly protein TadD